jgi:hypothetical protein
VVTAVGAVASVPSVLEPVDLDKAFGHIQALRGVSPSVAGSILLDGHATSSADPLTAHALEIETVYQDGDLAAVQS